MFAAPSLARLNVYHRCTQTDRQKTMKLKMRSTEKLMRTKGEDTMSWAGQQKTKVVAQDGGNRVGSNRIQSS